MNSDNNNKRTEYMGYNLFLDVEDVEMRNRNRGVVLLNLFEDYNIEGRVDPAGMAAILGYFSQIPNGEKLPALEYFHAIAKNAGYLGKVTEH